MGSAGGWEQTKPGGMLWPAGNMEKLHQVLKLYICIYDIYISCIYGKIYSILCILGKYKIYYVYMVYVYVNTIYELHIYISYIYIIYIYQYISDKYYKYTRTFHPGCQLKTITNDKIGQPATEACGTFCWEGPGG